MRTQYPRRRRWLWIALFAACAAMMAGNIVRLLALPDALAAQISLNVPLEILFSLIWMLAFGWVVWGLIRRKSGTRVRGLVLFTIFMLYNAARLTLYVRADYDRGRLPFVYAIAGGAALICVFMIVLSTRNRKTSDKILDEDTLAPDDTSHGSNQ